jgi:hypothetical protein
MPHPLSPEARIEVAKDQVSCELAEEAIILNLQAGVYYGLNSVASFIWKQLQGQPRTLAQLRDAIVETYDVSPERCEQDLQLLLEKMAKEGLIHLEQA